MTAFLINMAYHVLPFLAVIGPVITVHEFGHFLAAKAVDTKIDQFAIGFGKPWARWVDKSGVEWRLGWAPFGGFVRFAGDDNAASVPDQDDLDALRRELVAREGEAALAGYYHFKPIWQRAVISAAGPVANFLLSIAIFAAMLMVLGEPITPAKVEAVTPNSPAVAPSVPPMVRIDSGAPRRTTSQRSAAAGTAALTPPSKQGQPWATNRGAIPQGNSTPIAVSKPRPKAASTVYPGTGW